MRMMLQITPDPQIFNGAVKDGSAAARMGRILEQQKPEAAYFSAIGGKRCAILVVDVADASKIPSVAEPWFLAFNATIEMHPVMTVEDLMASGIDQIGKDYV